MKAQPHGGALLPGGKPGNRGGTGRPPNELRGALRELLDTRGFKRLGEIITDPQSRPRDVLRAVELCMRYGLGLRWKDEEGSGPLLVVLYGDE